MPKLIQNKLPAYRRHKASGQAIVTLGGKDIYLGPHGTEVSKVEYDRLIAEWLVHGRSISPDPEQATPRTVLEIIAAYVQHAQRYYVKDGAPTPEVGHVRIAMRPVRRLYGRTPAMAFGPIALKAVRQAFIEAGYTRKYVNDSVARIKRMFKWAVENELVPPSVHHGLQAVSGLRRGRSEARETGPVTAVPDEFVEAVRPFVSRQVWTMIELQRLTGMRPGEVVIMRSCDVDMSGQVWLYTPSRHKTEHHGRQRSVEIGPRAQELVKQFLKADALAHLFSPTDAESERRANQHAARKTPLSCGNRPGTNRKRTPNRQPSDHYTVASYRRAIQRACDSADREAKKTRNLPLADVDRLGRPVR